MDSGLIRVLGVGLTVAAACNRRQVEAASVVSSLACGPASFQAAAAALAFLHNKSLYIATSSYVRHHDIMK